MPHNFGSKYAGAKARAGTFRRPDPGGYVLRCVSAKIAPNSKNAPMLTLEMDVAEGEFAEAFKKYPLRMYQNLDSAEDGSDIERTKALIQAFEGSNDGLQAVDPSGVFQEARLVGRLVGGALRDEQYIDRASHEVKDKTGVAWLCSVSDARGGKVRPPRPKLVSGSAAGNSAASHSRARAQDQAAPNDGTSRPAPEDDLPF